MTEKKPICSTVLFSDLSAVSDVEKAKRFLTSMKSLESAYYYDDGFPRSIIGQDASATLSVLATLEARLEAAEAEKQPLHGDDKAVDIFATAMKEKLAAKRAEGYSGWDDEDECSVEYLAELFISHLPKGDMIDVANFAMMLWHRTGGTGALVDMLKGSPGERAVHKQQLAEAQRRIAELEAELARKDDCIVDGLMKRKALERELAEARKDAERYRWLRHRFTRAASVDMSGRHTYTFIGRTIGRGLTVDDAIDASMQESRDES